MGFNPSEAFALLDFESIVKRRRTLVPIGNVPLTGQTYEALASEPQHADPLSLIPGGWPRSPGLTAHKGKAT